MDTTTTKKAVIDIGSNSIRLVIYSYNSMQGLKELHNFKTVARLSLYIDNSGHLSSKGIYVLMETLTKFKELLEDMHVTDVFVAATAAIRQAKNRDEILILVKDRIGFTIDILSAKQEAFFGYIAVVHSTNIPTAVTIDMGGGSTEVTYFEDKKLKYSFSFPFGAVSLKAKFMYDTTMLDHDKKELIEYVKEQFLTLDWLRNLKVPIIAIGGSARNIAQVDQQRKVFPLNGVHQYELKSEDLQEISYQFTQCSLDGLKKIDGLSSDRADIIVPALETFRIFMEVVDAPSFIYSKKGLREGIIISQLMENNPVDFNVNEVTENAIRHVLGKFNVKKEDALHLYNIFTEMYLTFSSWKYIDRMEHGELVRFAYELFHIGEQIDQDAASQHTFYLLTNLTIDGISSKERLKIALLASYKNKDTFKQYVNPNQHLLDDQEVKQLRDIGALLRFTKGMDVLGRSNIKHVTITRAMDVVILTFTVVGNCMLEKYQAEKLKKHIEKIVSTKVKLVFMETGENRI